MASNFPTQAIKVTGTGVAAAVPAPPVTAITPKSGSAAGGTKVTITGKNFVKVTAITIGGVP